MTDMKNPPNESTIFVLSMVMYTIILALCGLITTVLASWLWGHLITNDGVYWLTTYVGVGFGVFLCIALHDIIEEERDND